MFEVLLSKEFHTSTLVDSQKAVCTVCRCEEQKRMHAKHLSYSVVPTLLTSPFFPFLSVTLKSSEEEFCLSPECIEAGEEWASFLAVAYVMICTR